MKRYQLLYLLPAVLAMLVAFLLTFFLLPENLYIEIALIVIIPLIVLAIGFRIITYFRIRAIRSQLFQIFSTLEEFDVDEPKKIEFEASSFPIFNELNEYLVELVDRIRNTYRANKQFTQNASHELQTPLAIIKGNVELLIQSPIMREKEIEALAVILQNTNRLSKLNSTLILLSKIEHSRFADTKLVSFNLLTDELLSNFKDGINLQGISIRKNYQAEFKTEMSVTLAEILIANLIQNAIRYNLENGFIEIDISERKFSISNPGKTLKVTPNSLFKRFHRESEVEESLGLGLSIVKRICDQYDLDVTYVFENELHTLSILPAE